MPQVEVRLIFTANHGESGEVLCSRLFEFLQKQGPQGYEFLDCEFLGASLTEDELDTIRWEGEGGSD